MDTTLGKNQSTCSLKSSDKLRIYIILKYKPEVNDVSEEQILTRQYLIKKIVADFVVSIETAKNLIKTEYRGVQKL